jgi:hypothetical protein
MSRKELLHFDEDKAASAGQKVLIRNVFVSRNFDQGDVIRFASKIIDRSILYVLLLLTNTKKKRSLMAQEQ